MKVYRSTDTHGISSYFDNYIDVLEEFKAFLDNGITSDAMTFEFLEMTEEEFKSIQSIQTIH